MSENCVVSLVPVLETVSHQMQSSGRQQQCTAQCTVYATQQTRVTPCACQEEEEEDEEERGLLFSFVGIVLCFERA